MMTPADAYACLRTDPAAAPLWADWFADRGQPWVAAQLRSGPPPPSRADGGGYGWADGQGCGDGGNGSGGGCGDGDGYGRGDGRGDGTMPWSRTGAAMPEVGTRQLIVLPHGWVIAGDVAEQLGPYLVRVENAVVICDTGGVPWDALADGTGDRSAGTYRRWGRSPSARSS